MTARVLVVDDILANVKLLEARLVAEYFQVLSAFNGQEALEMLTRERVDVVLLDVMMPGMDGFEVCRRIKSDPRTQHIPVIMVTALDQTSDRIQGLEAGADDFLTKPVDDIALVTRVKNLARLKMLNDEMVMRASTSKQLGFAADGSLEKALSGRSGRVLVVEDHPRSGARVLEPLSKLHDTFLEGDPQRALKMLTDHDFDVAIISLSLAKSDGLRLCSQLRSLERTRHLPLIILVEPGEDARLMRGLDMGINDYLIRPIEKHELLARVRTQIKRKRHSDFLRNRFEETVEQAVRDALTGLHNRRYMEHHLDALVRSSAHEGRSLSMLVADIDFFKHVNDTYGHDAGDAVLREFAKRIRRSTRGVDLTCRLGGEEFVVIMPDTENNRAYQIGERLRAVLLPNPFVIGPELAIRVTVSIGLATLEAINDTWQTLFRRADQALYDSKRSGRNKVSSVA